MTRYTLFCYVFVFIKKILLFFLIVIDLLVGAFSINSNMISLSSLTLRGAHKEINRLRGGEVFYKYK